LKILNFYYKLIGDWGLGIGDWGLGIGDWGLGPIPNPQSPIPNPHYPLNQYLIFTTATNNNIKLYNNIN